MGTLKDTEKIELRAKLGNFYRFYSWDQNKEGGTPEGSSTPNRLNSTKPMYTRIIGKLAELGCVPEESVRTKPGSDEIDVDATIEQVAAHCERHDQEVIDAAVADVDDGNVAYPGKIEEEKIGIRGYLKQEDANGKKIDYHEIGKKAIAKILNLPSGTMPSPEDIAGYIKKTREEMQGYTEIIEKEGETPEAKKTAQAQFDAKREEIEEFAFFAMMGYGEFFPRLTMASAAHHMNDGNVMQIGCSQGKTSVVAMTTIEQYMMGRQVYSTSSAPELVPENYDEARQVYEALGINDHFCSVSRNSEGKSTITFLHGGKKYEINSDGEIYTIKEGTDGKNIKEMVDIAGLDDTTKTALNLVIKDGKLDFEGTVKECFEKKGIIMGDTKTLQRYMGLMNVVENDTGTKENEQHKTKKIPHSFLISDEADVEVLDVQPTEILSDKEIDETEHKERQKRRKAIGKLTIERVNNSEFKQSIDEDNFTIEDLEIEDLMRTFGLDEMEGDDLEYALDALTAYKYLTTDESGKQVIDKSKVKVADNKKVLILNPETNVFEPAPQGVAQMLLALDEDFTKETVPEYEVLGETTNSDLFSLFSDASLMSGTMQDLGYDTLGPDEKAAYIEARKAYFSMLCSQLGISVQEMGVVDWDLVTPPKRLDRGQAVITTVSMNGPNDPIVATDKDDKEKITTAKPSTEVEVENWRNFLANNGKLYDDMWRQAVSQEAKRRSEGGQPVMVSVYGDRIPIEDAVVFTETQKVTDKPYRRNTYARR